MAPLSPKQLQRVDGVCEQLEKMLRLRNQLLLRLKPSIEILMNLLVLQKVAETRQALSITRRFGGESYLVCDILVSTGEGLDKRVMLLSRDGEASLYPIVGPTRAAKGAHEATNVNVAAEVWTLVDYYTRVDPAAGQLAELVGHWTWWDLVDAADLYTFEQVAQRYEAIRSAPALSDAITNTYRAMLKREPSEAISREDILAFETKNFQRILLDIERRRAEEPVSRRLLAYEPRDADVRDEVIMDIARSQTALDRIRDNPVLAPPVRAYYAQKLGLNPNEVTTEQARHYEEENIHRRKREIIDERQSLEADPHTYYDYKERLFGQLRARCEALCARTA